MTVRTKDEKALKEERETIPVTLEMKERIHRAKTVKKLELNDMTREFWDQVLKKYDL